MTPKVKVTAEKAKAINDKLKKYANLNPVSRKINGGMAQSVFNRFCGMIDPQLLQQ
jgi:hypothetical protein